jgi:hypothetical protein
LNPSAVLKKIESMLSSEKDIRSILHKKVPLMERRALNAGKYLHHLVDGGDI